MADQEFLVAIDNHVFFYERIPNGSVTGTRVPSAAARFPSYGDADDVCQRLRRQGHHLSFVTDALGKPIDIDTLKHLDGPVYVVRFGKDYFGGRDGSGQIVGTHLYPVAKKMHHAVAEAVAKNLCGLGYPALVYRMHGESSWEQGDIDNARESEEYREAWGEGPTEVTK